MTTSIFTGAGTLFPDGLNTPTLDLGTPSSTTGQLLLANEASTFLTTIKAGNAAAARTYTWPTDFGAAGTVLADAAGNGTLSWQTGGGAGSPGGVSGDFQFNNSGAFGGSTGFQFINGGISGTISNPTLFAAQGSASGMSLNFTFDRLLTAPSFTDQIGFAINMDYRHGVNIYTTGSFGQTLAKYTPIAFSVSQNCVGAAEHLCSSFNMFGWGGSDTFLFAHSVYYATAPIAGDEGVGLTALESGVFQQIAVYPAHISSVTRTTYSTTLTANVTGSQNSQVISVASVSGATVGDWIIFNQSLTDNAGSIWASKIEAINSGASGTWPNITCICAANYLSGVTITPALVLGISDNYQMGEQRLLVNMSAAANYSTGQVYFGWPLVGVNNGTWSATVVGGNATNVGAISIDQDIYADANGPGGFVNGLDYNNAFKSWYPIGAVTASTLYTIATDIANIKPYAGNCPTQAQLFSTTCTLNASTGVVTMGTGSAPPVGTAIRFTTTGALPTAVLVGGGGGGFTWAMTNRVFWVANPSGSTFSLSVTSDSVTYLIGSFTGSNTGTHTVRNGGYTIAPSARILQVNLPSLGFSGVVCETSTATWTVGDVVCAAISPTSYVMGWNWAFGHWNPGATLNDGISLANSGARAWAAGLTIGLRAGANTIGRINSDPHGWVAGIQLSGCETGIRYFSAPSSIAAINIDNSFAPTNDAGTSITWNYGYWQSNHTNAGLTANMTGGTSLPGGILNGVAVSTGINSNAHLAELEWNGWMRLSGLGNVEDPFLEFGNVADYAGRRSQIQARTSNAASGIFGNAADGGLDFYSVNGSGLGTAVPLFALGAAGAFGAGLPFAGWPAQGASTSNTTNKSSSLLVLGTSVWPAAHVATLRPAILQAIPGSGIDDAPVALHAMFYDSRGSYFYGDFVDAFSISETGILTFGQSDPSTIGTPFGVAMDPSKTTAVRTVTWPDISGGNMVAASASAPTSATAGTPGEVLINSTNVYVYVSSGNWIKLAGTAVP